jgi:hypothetical protein
MGFGRGRWVAPYYGNAPYQPPVGLPYAAPTREQELDGLKGQAEYFKRALDDIKARMEELEAGEKAE